ncbi:MAG: phage integrase SAM-like domain-containing protein [Desulfobacterales bacterium]
MSHVIQRPSGCIYRQVIPADLRALVGKGEVRYSLKERSLYRAERKAQSITGQLKGLFTAVREETLTLNQPQINRIIRNIIETTVADMEREKLTGKPLTRRRLADHLSDLEIFEHDYKEALALRECGVIEPFVDVIIRDFSLNIEKDSEDYRKLAGEVLMAHIKILEVERQQSVGDYSYKDKLLFQNDVFEPESPALSIVAAEYWKERSKNWSPRTVTEYQKFQDELLSFVGHDFPILSVDYKKGREYKAHLDSTELSAVRKDNYLGYASALWKWAIKRHYAEINAFDGLQEGKAAEREPTNREPSFLRMTSPHSLSCPRNMEKERSNVRTIIGYHSYPIRRIKFYRQS